MKQSIEIIITAEITVLVEHPEALDYENDKDGMSEVPIRIDEAQAGKIADQAMKELRSVIEDSFHESVELAADVKDADPHVYPAKAARITHDADISIAIDEQSRRFYRNGRKL